MKLTIITPTLNSDKSIAYTLNSVFIQTYKNIEHIIVDGGSTDNTLDIVNKHKIKQKIIIKKKSSIYEAINLGIKNSTGDYILVLNSDDFLNSPFTIKKIINKIKETKAKILFGNVCFYNNFDFKNIVRYFSAKNFKRWMMFFGLMPPHTGAIIHKNIYKKYKLYDPKFKIAGDFDFFLKLLLIENEKFINLNLCVTRMRTGGVSGKDLSSHIVSSKEIINSFKKHKVKCFDILIYLRFITKLHQLFIFDKEKLNKGFKNNLQLHYLEINKFDFKIIKYIKSLDLKKNFVLSALNLAFLGSYSKGDISSYNELINWPDGIFVKFFDKKLRKIPGREIVKKLLIPKYINKITVFGNLSKKSELFLKKIYKKRINNIVLPFGDVNKITRNLNYKIRKDELIFITLPTPKQEQLAQYLKKKNLYFKIICIGGSINIASGEEKEVPKYISWLEFLWRLRFDTFRRISRLTVTFVYYLHALLISKKFKNKSAKIIQ